MDDYENDLCKLANKINTDNESICVQCKEIVHEIPEIYKKQLHDFAKYGSETGFILFRFGSNNIDKLKQIQALLLSCISDIIAYEAEGNGQLFQNIIPEQKMAEYQTSTGSATELEIHTEQAFSNLKPDILALGCIRGDPNAITYILPMSKIINNLSAEDNVLLRKPLWKIGIDLSFRINECEFIDGNERGPIPIINEIENTMVFDTDLMHGITNDAESIIHKIVEIYKRHRIAHVLEPGDIIIIDNRHAVHGRSPFTPRYDGNDRYLIRSFATFDYNKSMYARPNGGRIVSAIYS
jgi:L-asparagine oxygenase